MTKHTSIQQANESTPIGNSTTPTTSPQSSHYE